MHVETTAHPSKAPYYYVPGLSGHPVRASISLCLTLLGAATWINNWPGGFWCFWSEFSASCWCCSSGSATPFASLKRV